MFSFTSHFKYFISNFVRHTAKEHWNILRYALWFIFGIQKKPTNLLINKKREVPKT